MVIQNNILPFLRPVGSKRPKVERHPKLSHKMAGGSSSGVLRQAKRQCRAHWAIIKKSCQFLQIEDMMHLGNENKYRFILHFSRFSLPLHHENQRFDKETDHWRAVPLRNSRCIGRSHPLRHLLDSAVLYRS